MMYDMLDQQWHMYMDLPTQGLVNDGGIASVINKPIIIERVNDGLVSSYMTMVQEGHDDSESNQGPLLLWKIQRSEGMMNLESIESIRISWLTRHHYLTTMRIQ